MPDPLLPRGAIARLACLALLAMALVVPRMARADDAAVFEPWLGRDSAKCLSIEPLKVVATVVTLAPAQFEFVRALYVAIPPISRQLPPGDRAVLAVAGDAAMVALVDGDQTCARMAIPDFILAELMAVGRGDVIHAGAPL